MYIDLALGSHSQKCDSQVSHLRQYLGLDKADHQGSGVGLVWLACKGLTRKIKGGVVRNVAISHQVLLPD